MTATMTAQRRVERATPRSVGSSSTAHRLHAVHPVSRSTYAVRRAVAAVVAAILVTLMVTAATALVGVMAGIGDRPAAASSEASGGAALVRIHVAQPGDTLWSIAESYRGDVPQARFVDALVDVNSGTDIQVGQAVRLP